MLSWQYRKARRKETPRAASAKTAASKKATEDEKNPLAAAMTASAQLRENKLCKRRLPLLDYYDSEAAVTAITAAAAAAALSCFLSSLATGLTRLLACKRALELGATTKTQSLLLLQEKQD